MEPITVISTALVAGAVAATKDVATQAVKDSYAGLKSLIVLKFGGKEDLSTADEQVEKKPDSAARRDLLMEELKAVGADQDSELLSKAQVLLKHLKEYGHNTESYFTQVIGSGAIAQGKGAVASGAGGVAVGGDVHGCVNVGGGATPEKV